MMPEGLAAVSQRVADIQARFRPSPGFAEALSAVSEPADGSEGSADEATGVRGVQQEAAGRAAGSPPSGVGALGAEATARARTGASEEAGREGAVPDWAARLPAAGREWAPAIERAATAAGVEPRLLAALVRAESGFDPSAESPVGATGLAQLMPGTAAALGVDAQDPEQNLAGGARYLREQLDRFGAVDLALAAYNAGPNRVAQAGGIPRIAETQSYVNRVREHYESLEVTR